jgi:PPK2 family polyphosphate:nucleotide phosphotransferase
MINREGAAMFSKKIVKALLVPAGKKIRLRVYPTDFVKGGPAGKLSKTVLQEKYGKVLQQDLLQLTKAQDLLYASDTYAILMILQAMDAAGKDSTIKHVMSGVNPQGCQVFSFKQPSAEELDHNFLWRSMKALPERGRIGIFNRSYYEEVLVVRVHPEWLVAQKLPAGNRNRSFWQERFSDINTFEHHLVRNGIIVLKFFLHVSKKEQKKRFLDRLDDKKKNWKFSASDVAERKYWDEYMAAYEEMLAATSTPWAPWYVIPADHKWITRALVADILTSTITDLKMRYPSLTRQQKQDLLKARKLLLNEK